MEKCEKKLEHLKLIHEVIGRLASNSHTIKSWNITLLSGIALIYLTNADIINLSLALFFGLVVSVFFCLLDGYYLKLEKSYRNFYDFIRNLDEDLIDFRMSFKKGEISEWYPSVSIQEKKKILVSNCQVATSASIYMFYYWQIISLVILLFITR